jgi:hypothetical protein
MKRYGILPAAMKPNHPLDVYAVDRAYWGQFPRGQAPPK